MIAPFTLHIQELAAMRNYRKVFEPVTFTLSNGQSLYLEGINGAGKTTLLRILAGINTQFQGTLLLNDLARQEWVHKYSEKILYIGHALGLKDDLTAFENIHSMLELRQIKKSPTDIFAVFETLAIPTQNRALRFLSAGQRRRVALARLWLEEAALWILDEPFTALDKASIDLLETKMCAHIARGGGIIFTSHQNPAVNVYTMHFNLIPFKSS